jgi:hypothetical protein
MEESQELQFAKNNVDVQGLDLDLELDVNKLEFDNRKCELEDAKILYNKDIQLKDIIFVQMGSRIRDENKKASAKDSVKIKPEDYT